MPRSAAFFEALTSYYGSVATEAVALMRSTQEDLRSERFEWSRTSSKVLSLWLDACDGWWSAMLVSATPAHPTLFVSCPADSRTHARTIKMLVPPGVALRVTDLARVGGGGAVAHENCAAAASSRGDEVTFTVTGLGGSTRAGLYQGWIYVGERALAQVALQLEPVAEPAPAPPTD